MRRKAILCLAVSATICGSVALAQVSSSEAAPSWSVGWEPVRLVNGTPIFFRVKAPRGIESLSGEWLGHKVFLSFDARSKTWTGIAGVSLETKPGTYSLQLSGSKERGKEVSFAKKLVVHAARYPRIAVTVAKKFTEPSPEQLQIIKQDQTIKEDVFREVSAQREWSGRFVAPADARVSDVFGTRRIFNGETQSVHQGLDYAVPQGTPVVALNAGTVLLARSLYFEGNCVVLDHGQGLLTIYMHLSEFKVKQGDRLAPGQELGLSGGTGRVTGPHLHVAVRWEGVYLDPATLLKLKLP